GATPRNWPPEAAPVPAMIDATWVAWPTTSDVPRPSSTNVCAASTLPARSGCPASMPVSRTATTTPAPVRPRAQAAGPPICGALAIAVAIGQELRDIEQRPIELPRGHQGGDIPGDHDRLAVAALGHELDAVAPRSRLDPRRAAGVEGDAVPGDQRDSVGRARR